jgi:hypothetical protein
MGLIAGRWARLRWIAVPIAAYLVVTLALPAANGAARDAAFLRHAGWVVAGCAAVVAVALAVSVAAHLAVRGLHQLRVNRCRSRGVVRDGGSP